MACESPPRKRAKLSLRFSRNQRERSPTKTMKKLTISTPDEEISNESCPVEGSPRKGENGRDCDDDLGSGPPQPYVGYYNIGNTCYLNSVLQALRYCPRFVATLGDVLRRSDDWLARIGPDGAEDSEASTKQQADNERLKDMVDLLKEMHKVYELMQDKEDNFLVMPSPDTDMAVNPEKVLDALRTVNPMFEGYLQHDAQELLCSLLSTLSEVRDVVSKNTDEEKADLTNNNLPRITQIKATSTLPTANAKVNGVGSLKGGCSPNLLSKSLKRTIEQTAGLSPVVAKKSLRFSSHPEIGGPIRSQRTQAAIKEEPGETVSNFQSKVTVNGKGDGKAKPRLRRRSMRNRQAEMPKRNNGVVSGMPKRMNGVINGMPKRTNGDVNGKGDAGMDEDKDHVSERVEPRENKPVCERSEAMQLSSAKVVDKSQVHNSGEDSFVSTKRVSGSTANIPVKSDSDRVDEKERDTGINASRDISRKKKRSLGMRRLYKLAEQLNILTKKTSPASSPSGDRKASATDGTPRTPSPIVPDPCLPEAKSDRGHPQNGESQGASSQERNIQNRDAKNRRDENGNWAASPAILRQVKVETTTTTASQPHAEPKDSETREVTGKQKVGGVGDSGDLFWGSLVLRTRCLECENYTERREEFQDVSVPVHCTRRPDEDEEGGNNARALELPAESNDSCDVNLSLASLDWALSEFTLGERLTDTNKYFCDRCLHLSEAERCLLFDELPQIMVVHLKRFSTMAHMFSPGGSIPKINDHMTTPLSFTMNRWCTRTCRQRTDTFRLLSLVTHTGSSSSSGHYLSYVRVPKLVPVCTQDGEPQVAPPGPAFEWVLFDDDQVTALTDAEFERSINVPAVNEESVDTPYLLFYTRVER